MMLSKLFLLAIFPAATMAATQIEIDSLSVRYEPVHSTPVQPINAWCPPVVQGHQIILATVQAAASDDAAEIRIPFCATPVEGKALEEIDGFELVIHWPPGSDHPRTDAERPTVRIHRNPGRQMVTLDDRLSLPRGEAHHVAIIKHGRSIRVFINDLPACEWLVSGASGDEKLDYTSGQVGVFNALPGVGATVRDLVIGRTLSLNVRDIAELRDMHLNTDLRRARIAVGEDAAHRSAAERLATSLEQKIGVRPEIVAAAGILDQLPNREPLILLGNMADNAVVRRLYMQWHTCVDRVFPGNGHYLVQTLHDPWGAGGNIVLVASSDGAGIDPGVSALLEKVPADGIINWIYDAQPAESFRKLAYFGDRQKWDQWEGDRSRLVLPYPWPQSYFLHGAADEDPQISGLIFLMTGSDEHAAEYRRRLLAFMEKNRIIGHLFQPAHMVLWDLLEEHPVFSNAERLTITNWFLANVRSDEAIGAGHIQRWPWGMPHQNHGTRPALGAFFMARYFDRHYHLPEMPMYLQRIARYFDMQADWSKPMCDSSMHQWSATLTARGVYAMTSGEMRFFESGAARMAAERALRTKNNAGVLPLIGDSQYGEGAATLLAQAALYYGDGRYLWPMSVRAAYPRMKTDELARSFLGDVKMQPPEDIVGVSVCPYDPGFWQGWRNLPTSYVFNPPTIEYGQAFDKIAFRTGLDPKQSEFLLLDGMIGASHDYDDTNTVHEYSVGDRIYITTCDGLFDATLSRHNGVNVIRDGLSSPLPYFAEKIHAGSAGDVLVSQTRVNDYSGSDQVRTIMLSPGRFFVVLDQVEARDAGQFSFTGRWRTLGEPAFENGQLTVRQWPRNERRTADNTTCFHLQVAADISSCETLADRHARNAELYPYAPMKLNNLEYGSTRPLARGESGWLYTLGHATGNDTVRRYTMEPVADGVVAVNTTDGREWFGSPRGPVTVGGMTIDADVFHLTAERLTVIAGRQVRIGDTVLLDEREPVDRTLSLSPVAAAVAVALKALDFPGQKQQVSEQSEVPALAQRWHFDAGGAVRQLRVHLGNPGADVRFAQRQPLPASFGVVAVPSASGTVSFLDRDGSTVDRIDAGVAIHDVAVDDLDGDGEVEILLARQDCALQCLRGDGATVFLFQPEKQSAPNSALQLSTNEALHVFTAEDITSGVKLAVVTTADQRLHAVEPDGAKRWTFWSYAGFFSTYGLYDLEGEGYRHLVGGNGRVTSADSLFFVDLRDPRGDPRNARNPNVDRVSFSLRILNDGWGATLSSMAIADFTGEGRPQIAIGTGKTSLYLIDPRQKQGPIANKPTYRWARQLGDDIPAMCAVVVEGRAVLIAASLSGFVTSFDGEGNKRWSTPLGAPVQYLESARRGDQSVLVAVLKNGAVVMLDIAGNVLRRGGIGVPPAALAVTMDGDEPLILVAGEDGVVRALGVPAP